MEDSNIFLALICLALAVSVASVTLTKGKVFAPLREKVKGWSSWWGELINCPYCISHWFALALVLVYRPITVQSGFIILDLIVTALVVVALAAFSSGLILRAFGPTPQNQ